MASYDKAIESYKKTVTTAASVAASLMLMRGVVNELVPYEVRDLLFSGFGYLRSNMSSQHTIIVERKSDGFINNHVYDAVKTYLATRIDTSLQQRVRVSTMDESDKIMVSMAEGDEMVDMYEGTEFKWCLICRESSSDSSNNGIGSLPFILATAKAIKDQEKSLRIFMNEYDTWSPIDLHHPSTFDTLAMDLKLLYGPPGTGKSSLIAAMANHLRFDIYDLELTEVDSNSDLRRLLVGMSNRSILVVEDIDCTIELKQREEGEGRDRSSSTTEENKGEDKVTLSGLLNCVDGLWSTTGEERIIIFTTNYKERLDPALLRPGRMDMHIHMGHCTPESFRILANNYHSIDYHVKYPEIEELIEKVMVTPAEAAEVLMRNDDTDLALHDLVDLLPFVVATAKAMQDQHRNLKMHMIEYDAWTAVDLRHPSTFDTLAMDSKLKQSVMDDLERFVRRKDYYRRIGRAWKRGYLLYGPPGTGKSSLVAAMANYLKFDIYDLELTEVKSNSDLRRLLVGMSNRSILVVEDIDCSIGLQQRDNEGEKRAKSTSAGEESDDKVTLSGFLNFVDGLWSTSGEERIIIFTTNYRERLDPALLRPGRMDMHIHMGYCTPESFGILARNYHSVENHAMYPRIEQLIQEVMVSPAEVAEVLMRSEDSDVVLQDLLEFLMAKRKEAADSKDTKSDWK